VHTYKQDKTKLSLIECHTTMFYTVYHSMGQIYQINVCVSVYVGLCIRGHAYGRIFKPIFTEFGRNLWGPKSEQEELIRLGSKSKNVFPYFNPQNPKIYRRDRQFPAK